MEPRTNAKHPEKLNSLTQESPTGLVNTQTVGRRVLLAIADQSYAATLANFLTYSRYEVEQYTDISVILRIIGRRPFDVMVLDLDLTENQNLDVVSYLLERDAGLRIILLFDIHKLDRAVEGIRHGAFFYLPKTSSPSDIVLVVEKALHARNVEQTAETYEQTLFEELAGTTEQMQRVVELIRKVAPTDSTVLLLGESGTGKEIVANTIHRLSRRRDKPFVAVNCAALPETLLESELFGHVKGAFTGADRDKRGLFEEADQGTIFLDEIGEMSLTTQAKLLRVLQNGEIRRVGASVATRVNVRVIAATNRNLFEAVRKNEFREDLYFRLNVVQIKIPPLRERMDVLPALINHFLRRYCARFGKHIRGIDEGAMAVLRTYTYPGNVRELESIIAHAVIMADEEWIRARDLPDYVREQTAPRFALPYQETDDILPLTELEARHIRTALEKLKGNQSLVAKKLGISRSTLWRKMKEYGIEAPA